METDCDACHGYHRSLDYEESIHHDLGSFLVGVLVILLAYNHHEHELGVHTRPIDRLVQHVHRIGQQQNFDPGHHDPHRLLLHTLGIAIFALVLLPARYECSFEASKSRDLQDD